ncbi:MAG: hypothetical protein OXB86_04310 [Bdellovibrionales bacterium]|nr:hypothetical protein [Bdellovibrionales bacterium]
MQFAPVHYNVDQRSERGDSEIDLQEQFKSDKLDIVIVADTREGMEQVLSETFNASFIRRFESHDWKAAYTNTSVNKEFIEDSTKQGEMTEEDKACGVGGFLLQLLKVAYGFYRVRPETFVDGFRGVGACTIDTLSAVGNAVGNVFQGYREPEKPVNGQFLFFEREGNELENYLTKEQEGYEGIFSDTFKTGTGEYNQFDAPKIQEGISDPLAAALLVLFRDKAFFREGSQVILIVVSPKDTKDAVSFSDTHKFFQKIHGEDNSLQLIPVALTKNSNESCIQELESAGIDSPEVAVNLQRSISKNIQLIDICDPDVPDQLAEQMKQFVYPAG